MKVVEIKKYYNAGVKTHYLLIVDDEISVLDEVDEWCEKDPCGQSNGYSYEWELVDNIEIIEKVISDRIKRCNEAISFFQNEKNKITDYLTEQYEKKQN